MDYLIIPQTALKDDIETKPIAKSLIKIERE